MKKNLLSILLCISATLLFNVSGNAQSKLIHFWHFNNYAMAQYTDTIHGIPADYSTIAGNKAQILYAKKAGTSASYMTYIDSIYPAATDFDTVNARMSVPEGTALRVRNPSDSMNLFFYLPTTHYKNIKLVYGSQSSSVTRGQLHQVFSYSVDSGLTWKTTGLSMASDSAWLIYHRTTLTFTTDTTVNNNPKLVLRITFSGNDTGTKGNNRFDNVTLEGDTVTSAGPGAVSEVLASASYSLYPNPVSNTLQVTSEIEGEKTVSIVSLEGKTVFAANLSGKHFPVNVANLPGGVYFITIRNNENGSAESLRFIKQ